MAMTLKQWRTRIMLFLAVVGPGFITANVDNDAGGIWTYSVAGAQFGYTLLWAMIPTTIALVVVQEMASRMGAVTGKGLSDLIREEFGFRMTFWLMLALVITNFVGRMEAILLETCDNHQRTSVSCARFPWISHFVRDTVGSVRGQE